MTTEEWETLKQAQRRATKGGNLAELNRTNKTLFKKREKRKKQKNEQESKSEKKCFLLKFLLSAKKCFLWKMRETCKVKLLDKSPFCTKIKI